MKGHIFIPNRFNVVECNILPIDTTYPACDLETKEEIRICTEQKTHMIKVGNTIYVSKEAMGLILKTHLPTF